MHFKIRTPAILAEKYETIPYADQRSYASFNFRCSLRKIGHQLLLGLAIHFFFYPLGFCALDAFLIHTPTLSVFIRVAAEQCTGQQDNTCGRNEPLKAFA